MTDRPQFTWITAPIERPFVDDEGRTWAFTMPASAWTAFDDVVARGAYTAPELKEWAISEHGLRSDSPHDEHLLVIIEELVGNDSWTTEALAAFNAFCETQSGQPGGMQRIRTEGERFRALMNERFLTRQTLFDHRPRSRSRS